MNTHTDMHIHTHTYTQHTHAYTLVRCTFHPEVDEEVGQEVVRRMGTFMTRMHGIAALFHSIATLLSHCCYTLGKLLLHCWYTVVKLLSHYCHTVVDILL
jgi:hypothetical protein